VAPAVGPGFRPGGPGSKIGGMSDRPSQLWRDMPVEKRVVAAAAFWRDTDSPEIAVQHAEAIGLLARRLNFRVRSLQALPIERRARHLAQMNEMTDAIATRALIAYHFEAQRPLMAAFLDALGIAHEDGLITAEDVTAPPVDTLATAVETVRASFPSDDVELYLRTLATLDGDTWTHLQSLLASPKS
jgi:hypothetical protein